MPDNVEGAPNPVVRLPGARVNEHTHYSRLEGNYQDYVKGRESAYLRKAQRKRRKLAEAGAVEFSVVSDPAELGPTMDVLVRQKSRRHTRDGGRDPYAANPRLRAFYERLTLTGRDDPRGFLGRLTVNGEIVGTEWGFVHRGRFLDILPSYEASEWAKLSPGMIIKEDVFRWCFEQGLRIFDLTVGDEPYKSRIAEVEEPVYALHRPLTIKGQLFCARLHLRQAVRKVLGPPRQWLRSLFRRRGQAQ
jgi:CelD/BcsL family acetyltransferase involved in cellulose biosynthesis